MTSSHSQRGSIIIFSVLLLTVILTVSLGLIATFVPKLRTISDSSSSTAAIFAADSATELCIYEARKRIDYNDSASTMNDGQLDNSTTFEIRDLATQGIITSNCSSALSSASYSFRAVGNYRGVSRALEITQ